MEKAGPNDKGFISGKGAFGILLTVLIVYSLVSFFPIVQIPFSLEGEVLDLSKKWLQSSSRDRQRADLKRFKGRVVAVIEKHLNGKVEYDPSDLVFDAAEKSDAVRIRLPYTIIVHLFWMEYTFEKELNIQETAWRF